VENTTKQRRTFPVLQARSVFTLSSDDLHKAEQQVITLKWQTAVWTCLITETALASSLPAYVLPTRLFLQSDCEQCGH